MKRYKKIRINTEEPENTEVSVAPNGEKMPEDTKTVEDVVDDIDDVENTTENEE